MEELIKILESVEGGVSSKITITKEQKKVLDNFVVAYMAIINNTILSSMDAQKTALSYTDEKWENLFEVTE